MLEKIKHLIKANPWLGFFFIMQIFIIVWGGVVFNLFEIKMAENVSFFMYSYPEVAPGWEDSRLLQFLVGPWYRWDGGWFIRIAVEGYMAVDPRLAFPPIYPMLVRSVGWVLGGQYLLAAMLVSQGALLIACFLLYEEFKQHADTPTALRSMQYLLIFPTAFFFFIGYTESLFLLFLVLSFRAGRREEWLKAGMWGALGALTRFSGVLILLPLGYLWLRSMGKHKLKAALALGLIPLAFFGWSLIAKSNYGWFPWEALDDHWDSHWDWPWVGVFNNLRVAFNPEFLWHYYIHADVLCVLIFLGLTVRAFRKLPFEYGLLMSGMVVMVLTTIRDGDIFMSASRYVLPIFPGYLMLAEWGEKRWFRIIWLLLSLLLMLLLSGRFINWGWVA